jgi:hypothetical protein
MHDWAVAEALVDPTRPGATEAIVRLSIVVRSRDGIADFRLAGCAQD